ncbi:3-dehydroquinate dehydratase [Flavobacteriaceae bacterium MAR_2010_188]|nr:3-dehydroquinate dehydratase [Flavobacteriaceae bacterium MAR_2010_188]
MKPKPCFGFFCLTAKGILERFCSLTFYYIYNMKKLIIINGPNLNLLGKREPNLYGNLSFTEFLEEIKQKFSNHQIEYFQSNVEGELINKLHEVGFSYDGIVLNAAAYTHTSVGIGDAVKAIKTPVVEVHISNTYGREEFRHHSFIASSTKGVIVGFGLQSYALAIQSFID